MIIHLIAAARPNYMKIAPLYHALKNEDWIDPKIVHTGQHYDLNMSDAFFEDLGLPEPDIHLGVGSGTHAEQTGKVMMAYEKIILERRPDLIVVVGDVNSTMAATLAAVKLGIKTAHLEAGLRSFDRTMPEEINRLVTDALVDILWTPSPDADENLIREGVSPDRIHYVGNIMIDSLEMLREKIEDQAVYNEFALKPGGYNLVTLHRPTNVDNRQVLRNTASYCTEDPSDISNSPSNPEEPRAKWINASVGKNSRTTPCEAAELYPLHESCVQLLFRYHRLRRHSGRDHLPRYSLPDHAAQYRAANHH